MKVIIQDLINTGQLIKMHWHLITPDSHPPTATSDLSGKLRRKSLPWAYNRDLVEVRVE